MGYSILNTPSQKVANCSLKMCTLHPHVMCTFSGNNLQLFVTECLICYSIHPHEMCTFSGNNLQLFVTERIIHYSIHPHEMCTFSGNNLQLFVMWYPRPA